jgi:hypothetical protein
LKNAKIFEKIMSPYVEKPDLTPTRGCGSTGGGQNYDRNNKEPIPNPELLSIFASLTHCRRP